MSDSAICHFCSNMETTIHVLRDCHWAKSIWFRLVPVAERRSFFQQDLVLWLNSNIQGIRGSSISQGWALLFGIAVWKIWLWRNTAIFQGTRLPIQQAIWEISRYRDEVQLAQKTSSSLGLAPQRVERWIKWCPPPTDWFKLNTDGACRGSPGMAGAGGNLSFPISRLE